jgi:hypothetical protein
VDEEFAARQEELVPSWPIETDERDPQIGDYPVIEISNQLLSPRGWWDQQARRNFGDPVSLEIFTIPLHQCHLCALGS